MTIRQVAKAAGVSTATVSRVLNADPYTSAAATAAVRRAIAETKYTPNRRRRRTPSAAIPAPAKSFRLGFFILGLQATNPATVLLLKGVTQAAKECNIDLRIEFAGSIDDVARQAKADSLDGLVLHGVTPTEEESGALHSIPTVWLMGGSDRAPWGDQVMPDNDSIGRIAGSYLLRNGHGNVAYFGIEGGWFYRVRALAFQEAVLDGGGEIFKLDRVRREEVLPGPAGQAEALALFKEMRDASPRPTGLFVADDWLLGRVYAAAAEAGLRIGKDVTIISCNNDRVRLEGLEPMPATIDIHFERIAYRGVQLLAYRLKAKMWDDRVRILMEPTLILP